MLHYNTKCPSLSKTSPQNNHHFGTGAFSPFVKQLENRGILAKSSVSLATSIENAEKDIRYSDKDARTEKAKKEESKEGKIEEKETTEEKMEHYIHLFRCTGSCSLYTDILLYVFSCFIQ